MSNAAPKSAPVTLSPIQGKRLVAPRAGGNRWAKRDAPDDAFGRVPCFVAGPENELIAAVFNRLIASVQSPAAALDAPSPILLVGPTGSGKTHLAQGIVELWRSRRSGEKPSTDSNSNGAVSDDGAWYVTAADFRRALADAIDRQSVREFRRRVRRLQLLVIDDAHRLSDSESSALELRHTLDAMQERGSLVLLTMQGPLAERAAFDRSTLSRLASGLTLEIAPPGRDARRELLRQASAAAGCTLDDGALDTLADQLPPEPTQVLRAVAELRRRRGSRADATAAQQLIDDDRPQQTPPLRDILRVVARYHQVPLRVLTSASRKQGVVAARAMAIYLARQLTPLSYAEIGQSLGGRDHTTVMHNYRRIVRELPKDRALQSAVDDLKRLLTTQ